MEDRFFSCNSDSFTKEHNDIMDMLLWCWHKNGTGAIGWNDELGFYYPMNERGLKILKHLRDCDLIEEVTNND